MTATGPIGWASPPVSLARDALQRGDFNSILLTTWKRYELGMWPTFGPKSMATQQEPIDWRYLPYIRPIFEAYVREYPHKI